MKATKRMYLTADRTRVVEEDDPAANFLWKTPGKDINAAEMKQYGLTEPKPEAESKAVSSPPENKAEAAPVTTRVARGS